MDPRYQQIFDSLNSAYNPQRDVIKAEITNNPKQFDPERQATEQAKKNAFRDIDLSANRKGILFSGFSPEQQMQYTGTTYLPKMADIERRQNQRRLSLEEALTGIDQAQSKAAMSTLKDILDREEKERQAELDRQNRLRAAYASRSGYASSRTSNPAKGYGLKQKPNNAGYSFYGPNGRPLSMAQYAEATGVSMMDLLRQSASQYDQNAFRDARTLAGRGITEKGIILALRIKYPRLF